MAEEQVLCSHTTAARSEQSSLDFDDLLLHVSELQTADEKMHGCAVGRFGLEILLQAVQKLLACRVRVCVCTAFCFYTYALRDEAVLGPADKEHVSTSLRIFDGLLRAYFVDQTDLPRDVKLHNMRSLIARAVLNKRGLVTALKYWSYVGTAEDTEALVSAVWLASCRKHPENAREMLELLPESAQQEYALPPATLRSANDNSRQTSR